MPPSDAVALVREAEAALARRDPAEALARLAQAESAGPADAKLYLNKALALRMLGRDGEAIAALNSALTIDPYDFIALLSKGALLDKTGAAAPAATAYKAALAIAPPPDRLPPALAPPLERARQAVARHAQGLEDHLRTATGDLRAELDGEEGRRFDEALQIFAGTRRAFVQEPLLLHYPRLPAIPFYDRAEFPWLARLEAATPVIQAELAAFLDAGGSGFAPYIDFPAGSPVNQWADLNRSPRWSSLFLWRDGARQTEVCDRFPQTAALLETLPLADQTGFAPTVTLSALQARTAIPPHTGSSNTRLIVHLPLRLPGPARFRVGNETRDWRIGEAWVFDDTIEHEAWNDADETRIILILDIWNPRLSLGERALVEAMMAAKATYAPG